MLGTPATSWPRRAAATRSTVLPWPASREQGARWCAGLLVVLALVLGQLEGGFDAERWGPAGIAVLWLAVGAWARARPARLPRHVSVALVAYGALACWTAASVLWAGTPTRAAEAAGLTALYGAALALVLLPRWPRASVRRLLGLVAIGTTILAAVTLVRVATSADPSSSFIDGRLVAPAGYVNAAAGIWVIVLPVLVWFAAGGARNPFVRVAALTAAALVLQVGLLSQSRGALIAIAVAVVVLVAVAPDRGATIVAAAGAGLAAAIAAPAILDVRGAPTVSLLVGRIDHAADRMVTALVVLAIAGLAWQLVLDRLPATARAAVAGPRLGNGLVAVLAVVALVGVVAAVGNPVSWTSGKVDEALNGGYGAVAASGDRLTGSLGSNRGDMYRVALDSWRDHPVRGIGAEDFQAAYLRDRRSDNSPRYAHSLPLGILAGLGTVGALLALVVLGTLLLGVARVVRRADLATRSVVAAALAGFVGWLAQAAWDWTWEFPALTILALVLLGVAVRATDGDGAAPSAELRAVRARARAHGLDVPDDAPDGGWARPAPRTVPRRIAAAALVLIALAATVGFAALGASSYFFSRGTEAASSDPWGASLSLARAARLNPLDGDATLSRAIVLRRLGDRAAWRAELVRTLRRSPDDWLARLELGIADADVAGRRKAGFAQLRIARSLNPRQPVIQQTIDVLRRQATVDPAAVEAKLAGRQAQLVKPTAAS